MKHLILIISLLSVQLVLGQSFERTETAFTEGSAASRSAAFVDMNNDGWLDIYITNGLREGENNELYINNAQGSFVKKTDSPITLDNSPSDGATWGDIDNDGDLDLFFATWYGQSNRLYLNETNEIFVESKIIDSQGYSEAASWADFNKNGFLDLFITNSSNGGGSLNQFFINQTDGSFSEEKEFEITKSAKNSRSVNWIDFDNDNDLDLFVSNEGGNNELYSNESGTLTAVTTGDIVTTSKSSTGSSWADYDNDGDLDLYVGNFGQNNELYINEGNGQFTSDTENIIVSELNHTFGIVWGDIDNDADLDLFLANGYSNSKRDNQFYLNNGDGSFTKNTTSVIVEDEGWSFGAALGDYDNDGFLDLVVANTLNEKQSNGLYHNLGNDNNWIIFNLEGTVSNRSAIGAKIKVTAEIEGKLVTQLREVSSQSGYNCQNSMRAHFGLSTATNISQVEIIWPLGNVETLNDIAVNQIMNIKEAMPSGFLRANFKADEKEVLTGKPLQFEDLSIYDDTKNVTYEWDFDNDGVVDSNDQNPSFSYSLPGTYSIKLILSNTSSETSELIREGYIVVKEEVLTNINIENQSKTIVYPNPSRSRITLNSHLEIEHLQLLDLHGKILMNYKEFNNLTNPTINVESLNSGAYLLYILTSDGVVEYQKIFKEL